MANFLLITITFKTIGMTPTVSGEWRISLIHYKYISYTTHFSVFVTAKLTVNSNLNSVALRLRRYIQLSQCWNIRIQSVFRTTPLYLKTSTLTSISMMRCTHRPTTSQCSARRLHWAWPLTSTPVRQLPAWVAECQQRTTGRVPSTSVSTSPKPRIRPNQHLGL